MDKLSYRLVNDILMKVKGPAGDQRNWSCSS